MKYSKILSEAESSPYGRVHTPWFPIKSSKRLHVRAPIDSVSAGHTIVSIFGGRRTVDESSDEKQKDE